MSYLDVARVHHLNGAKPKVMGQSEPLRAQFTNSSTLVTMNSTLFSGGAWRKSSADGRLPARGQEPRCVVRGGEALAAWRRARAAPPRGRARANAARSILLVSKVVLFNCRRGAPLGAVCLGFRGESVGLAPKSPSGAAKPVRCSVFQLSCSAAKPECLTR